MSKFRIGILGFGTVGSGVFNVLRENHDEILSKTGIDFEIVSILDLDHEKIISVAKDKKMIAKDIDDLINTSDVGLN